MFRRLRESWRRLKNPTPLQTRLRLLRQQTVSGEIEWEGNVVGGPFLGITMSYRWQDVELITLVHYTEGTGYSLRIAGEEKKLDLWERRAARRLFHAIGGFW